MGKTLPRQTPVMAVALLAAMLGAVVALGLAASAASAATFPNDDGITIIDGSEDCPGTRATEPGSATPYPSEIEVSDLGSSTSISDVNVTVSGLSHPFPLDVGLLLESPGGQRTLLMTDSGGGSPGVSGINVTFDDAASGTIPRGTGELVSGTYRPTEGTSPTSGCLAPLSFPDPAPAGPYSSSLSVFNGTNPNGTWKLYVIDDTLRDAGSIAGWSLDISVDTTAPSVTINQASSQADPTADSPIHFTAVFNEPVTGFTDSDVTLSGTAGATTAVMSEAAPNDGTTYDVAVSGMSSEGTVTASIPANAAQDAAQNGNSASTSTDNTVTFNGPDITINDGVGGCSTPGTATPYPSGIEVSGLSGSVTDVNVTISGLTHSWPDDIGLLLVSPAGQRAILMTDSGGTATNAVSNINVTFDDEATTALPDSGPLTSGTFYKPGQGTISDEGCLAPVSFPDPAPASPYGTTLSVFNDSDPNGTWKLYVIDDSEGDTGSITSWSLDISAGTASDTQAPKVISTFPRNGGEVGPARDVTATFSEDMREASVINAFKLFKKGSTNQIAAAVTYDAQTRIATLNPTNNLRRGATYKAVVTTQAKDTAGNRLDQNSSKAGLQQKVWFFEID